MNEKKMQQWGKWHKRGYKAFMLINLGIVLAFYAFTGTFAFVQLYMNMPESIKRKGGGASILLPGIMIIAIMIPLAIVFCHFMWKSKEKQYTGYLEANEPVNESMEEVE